MYEINVCAQIFAQVFTLAQIFTQFLFDQTNCKQYLIMPCQIYLHIVHMDESFFHQILFARLCAQIKKTRFYLYVIF